MNLTEIPRLLSPTRWAIVGVIFALAFFAAWYVLTEPGRANRRATEAKADSALSGSAASSAKDAAKTVAGSQDREWTIDKQAQEAENAIRNAPEDQRNRVALDALCLSDTYARHPSCFELRRTRPE